MKDTTDPFCVLRQVDIGHLIEQKNGLSYLSWANALALLMSHYPDSQWSLSWWEDLPYLKTEQGFFVGAEVTVRWEPTPGEEKARRRHALLPIMDHRNKPIDNPTTMDINKAQMRALTKAVALHGLGLSLYQGEDLVESQPAPAPTRMISAETRADLSRRKASPIQAIATYIGSLDLGSLTEAEGRTILARIKAREASEAGPDAPSEAVSAIRQAAEPMKPDNNNNGSGNGNGVLFSEESPAFV